MSRVLVTGASGFVGRHALAALAAGGHEVHAVSRTGAGTSAGVRWQACDLLDETATTAVVADIEPDLLLHLAWYVEPADFFRSPENLRWVGASLALLRAFAEVGGRRAVFTGTCAEYDWTDGGVMGEDAVIAPATLYGAAKDAVHRAGAAYGREAGFEFAWGRLFYLFGPGEPASRLVPAVVNGLSAGRPVETSSGKVVRDFLYIEDVAAALAALLGSSAIGAVNIGSGEGTVMRDLIEVVADATGNRELLRVGARPDRPGEPPVLVADATRLRDEVGFTAAVGIEEGVARTVTALRQGSP